MCIAMRRLCASSPFSRFHSSLASEARAQDRVIGLLTLPEVFGGEACTPFEPRPVPLYAEPASKREVASIRVDQYWSFAPTRRMRGSRSARPSRQREGQNCRRASTRYEAPAAIALDQRNGWFKIRLSDGAAWVAPAPHHQFLPLSKLFDQALTAITDQFTRPACDVSLAAS